MGNQDMGSPSRERLRIGLLWHSFVNDNLGVGALSIANAGIIARAAESVGRDVEFHVMGPGGNLDYRALCPGVLASEHDAGTKSALNPFSSSHRALAQCDVVFDIGGGDSFTDIYGLNRYALVVGAKLPLIVRGRPLVLCPQTIGPFAPGWRAGLARACASRARLLCSRDGKSTRYARETFKLDEVIEFSDVAFDMRYDAPASRPDGKPTLGLNVSGLLMTGGYSGANQFGLEGDYPSLIRRIIRHVLEEGTYTLHLVPHVIGGDGEGDNGPIEALADEFPECVRAPTFADPIAAKSYIAGLDAFAGSRMHATIAALSSGVPVLGLAYSRKFQGLYESLGYTANVDLASTSDDDAFAAVTAFLRDRERYAAMAKAAQAEAARRLTVYEEAVRGVLEGL